MIKMIPNTIPHFIGEIARKVPKDNYIIHGCLLIETLEVFLRRHFIHERGFQDSSLLQFPPEIQPRPFLLWQHLAHWRYGIMRRPD